MIPILCILVYLLMGAFTLWLECKIFGASIFPLGTILFWWGIILASLIALISCGAEYLEKRFSK